MDIKSNINKIDYDLSKKFQNFTISEKSSIEFGKYFEISINESKIVKIVLPYRNIDGKSVIDWMYYSNPTNESSDLIPRTSSVDRIIDHIEDILLNNRFSEEYKN